MKKAVVSNHCRAKRDIFTTTAEFFLYTERRSSLCRYYLVTPMDTLTQQRHRQLLRVVLVRITRNLLHLSPPDTIILRRNSRPVIQPQRTVVRASMLPPHHHPILLALSGGLQAVVVQTITGVEREFESTTWVILNNNNIFKKNLFKLYRYRYTVRKEWYQKNFLVSL